MGDAGVVQRPVRLDVGDAGAGDLGEGIERAELVEHDIAQLVGVDVDEAPTEARQVGVADLGADRHAPVGRRLAHPSQRRRVAGVGATGDVGAGDDVEHRLVVAETPHAERLTEIAVEVDRGHAASVEPEVTGPGSFVLRRAP